MTDDDEKRLAEIEAECASADGRWSITDLRWIIGLARRYHDEVEAAAALGRGVDANLAVQMERAEKAEAKIEGYRCAFWLIAEETTFVRAHGGQPESGDMVVAESVDGWPRLLVLCSDTFAWACADAEDATYPQAKEVWARAVREGWPGVVRWVQEQRAARGDEERYLIEPASRQMADMDALRERAEKAEADVSRLIRLVKNVSAARSKEEDPEGTLALLLRAWDALVAVHWWFRDEAPDGLDLGDLADRVAAVFASRPDAARPEALAWLERERAALRARTEKAETDLAATTALLTQTREALVAVHWWHNTTDADVVDLDERVARALAATPPEALARLERERAAAKALAEAVRDSLHSNEPTWMTLDNSRHAADSLIRERLAVYDETFR